MKNWRELGLSKSVARSINRSGSEKYCYDFLRALTAFRQVLVMIEPIIGSETFSTFMEVAAQLEDEIVDCDGFVEARRKFVAGNQPQIIEKTTELLGRYPNQTTTILRCSLSVFHQLDIDYFFQSLLEEFFKEVETLTNQA